MDPVSLEAVDLLAIGPHPDDIEIGIGGIVAKHAALGLGVGLCDLPSALPRPLKQTLSLVAAH